MGFALDDVTRWWCDRVLLTVHAPCKFIESPLHECEFNERSRTSFSGAFEDYDSLGYEFHIFVVFHPEPSQVVFVIYRTIPKTPELLSEGTT